MNAVLRYDPRQVGEETLRGLYEVYVVGETEYDPGVLPVSFEQWAIWARASIPTSTVMTRYRVEEDESVIGSATLMRWPQDDPENSFLMMTVLPGYRQRGVGRAMLEAALDDLEELGIPKIIVDCPAGRPWESVLGRLGLGHVFTERISRLSLERLDRGLMDRWIERAAERASEYSLLWLEDPIPEEHIDRWCRVRNVLNTAPKEDLEMADHLMNPEKWREREQTTRERQDRHVAFVAVHDPTGEFAGYTDVRIPALDRSRIYQDGTAVDPVHRDRGIGRWVKAAMAKWIIDNCPESRWIDTGNAGSNAAMLGINVGMGFETVLVLNAWQGDTATVRSNLSPAGSH